MAYKKIIVGVDGSETSLLAVRYAARLAALEKAELTTVYAHGYGNDQGSEAIDAVFTKARAVAADEGVEAKTIAAKGEPSEVLIMTSESEQADLLVLGNKGMTGVSRFLLGNVPNKVSHHSPCDLLIVKTT